jgi:penicillin V acylase-like amidase (Ntn superfamily)
VKAVDAPRGEPFTVVAPTLPNGAPAALHLSISDPSGDSAMFEYIDVRLIIHHGKRYGVMTNSPSYDQQLSFDEYW